MSFLFEKYRDREVAPTKNRNGEAGNLTNDEERDSATLAPAEFLVAAGFADFHVICVRWCRQHCDLVYFLNSGFDFLFPFRREFNFCGSPLARVVDYACPVGYPFLFEEIEVVTELHDVCGFHCGTGFDVVEDPVFVNKVYFNEVVDVPLSTFFARVTLVVEKLPEVNVFGGMLHFEVVLVEPEFACADVEVIDGGAGDVGESGSGFVFERET